MKKKLLKYLLWFVIGIITLVALLYAIINWNGARAWEKIEAELRAKGEPMWIEEVIPPLIPDDKNFANSPFLRGVFEMETVMENGRQVYRSKYPDEVKRLNSLALPQEPAPPMIPSAKNNQRTDIIAWQTYFRTHPEFQMPEAVGNPAKEVVLALNNWKAPLDEIARDLRARPLMRAPLHYDRGFEVEIPHIGGLMQVSKFYQLRAIAQIRLGNSTAALADLESILLLGNALEPRQTTIGCLVASVMSAHAIPVIREGLAAQTWDETQLSSLSMKLESINPLAELSAALRTERVVFLDATRRLTSFEFFQINKMSDSPSTSLARPDTLVWEKVALWGIMHLPRGIWDLDRALYCRLMQEQLDKVLDYKQGRFHVAASQDFEVQLMKHSTFPGKLLHLLTITTIPVLSRLGSKSAEMNVAIGEARVAIALERYRLAHSSIPENLTALVPEFLAQIPADPIDGKPLRYQKVSEPDYRIWSVGYNQKDDGGVADANYNKGDWLWTSLPPL